MIKKQGISLIVLVITIIVMIILAGSIILTLNNNGIIGKASYAVDESNLLAIKTEAELKQAEYILDNSLENGNGLEDWLNDVVKHDGYYIKVYNNQPYVIKEGTLVDKYYDGVINIGDYVGYNAGENRIELNQYVGDDLKNNMAVEDVTINSTSDMKWRVLGAEGDKIKLISEKVVNPDGETGFSLYGAYSYLKGVEILNNACSVFGKGKYAVSARSITADDINEITGFDKTKYTKDMKTTNVPLSISDVPYGTKINYNDKASTVINGKTYKFPILSQPDITAEDNAYVKYKEKTVELTAYEYSAKEQMKETDISEYSREYKLLFRNIENTNNAEYWLATVMNSTNIIHIDYGVARVRDDNYIGSTYLHITGNTMEEDASTNLVIVDVDYKQSYALRPVVILEGNILADNINNIWTFK